MTYEDIFESDETIFITQAEALAELEKHGIADQTEFYADLGDRAFYTAKEVLEWLGY